MKRSSQPKEKIVQKSVRKTQSSPFFKNLMKKGVRAMLLSKFFHRLVYVVGISVLTLSALYGAYAWFNPTLERNVIVSQSEIVSRISKLTPLPSHEVPEAVVRVENAEVLKKQSDFYGGSTVKEGDYIVIYPSLAVIYDLRNNTIIATKRMQ